MAIAIAIDVADAIDAASCIMTYRFLFSPLCVDGTEVANSPERNNEGCFTRLADLQIVGKIFRIRVYSTKTSNRGAIFEDHPKCWAGDRAYFFRTMGFVHSPDDFAAFSEEFERAGTSSRKLHTTGSFLLRLTTTTNPHKCF